MISAIPVQCSIVEVMGIYITVIYFTLPFRDRKRFLGRNSQVTPLPEITGRSNSTYNGNDGIQGDDPCHMEMQNIKDSIRGFSNMNYEPYNDAVGICEHNYERLDYERPDSQTA